MSTSTKPTMRERQRAATRVEITAAAMELFVADGFDATTVDRIVEVAGVSRRTFFHYFPSKEDVVLGDLEELGESVRQALESRPEHESAWEALGAALGSLGGDLSQEAMLATAQMYADTPSLRARHLEKHLRWQSLLAPEIERRLGLPAAADGDPRARALIAAALGALDVAIEAWRESGGAADAEKLYWQCVAAIRS